MIVVAPYTDESGTHAGAPITALAGYLATTEKWADFTNEWNQILDELQPWQSVKKEHYFFHMQKFAGNYTPYEKFADFPDEKANFAARIFSAIKKTREYGYAIAFHVEDYNALIDPTLQRQLGSPYTCAVQFCLGAVGAWVRGFESVTHETVAPIVYAFERGSEHECEAKDFLDLIPGNPVEREAYRYHDRVFLRKQGTPALQAADVLACESYRELARTITGHATKGNYYLEQLVEDPDDEIKIMDRAELHAFLKDNLNRLTSPE